MNTRYYIKFFKRKISKKLRDDQPSEIIIIYGQKVDSSH